jgi:hypothetical protein
LSGEEDTHPEKVPFLGVDFERDEHVDARSQEQQNDASANAVQPQ